MSKYTQNEMIQPRNVEEEMKDSYLRYSMSVIISRALPDVRDGLKPSQRRILFAMKQLNLSPGGKHRKCAKICGDTSGDYHPHGEQVIYPTMVRMAQDWAMRYSLVDGQGNFGSIDGDPPAAMRYTEARLTSAAIQLMDDLEKDTVDMVPNYDETKKEPTVFPSKFPNLISNGSSGIAVGMATNIPPQNLNELIKATELLLENPTATVEDILKVMPGPDFPTGGIICGYRGIRDAYSTGRGKIILRGVIHTEENPDNPDRARLVVTEIPYNVNKSRLIEKIADLVNDKQLNGIADLRDESDKDGMRIVLELKRNEIPEVTINQLYKYTDLQTTFGCNMLALDKGLPRTMNMKQLIQAWIEHRIEVIRRRTRFELNKAEARAHILEGYLKAIAHLDDVVKIIRASDNRDQAKEALKERYEFSEKQANAVLDLRLYQLTGLEHDKINDEYQELLKKIEYLKAVLASEEMVKDIIREELAEIQKNHKEPRRTEIQAAEGEVNMEDLIADEQVIVTISEDDYIKRMPIDTFREQKRGGQGVTGLNLKRQDDALKGLYVVSTHDYLLIFTSLGRVYWMKAWQVPEFGRAAKGRPLIQMLEDIRPEEKIATVLDVKNLTDEGYVFFATRQGTIKKCRLDEFSNPRRKGVWALDLAEGDQLVSARFATPGDQVMLFTYKGMAVRFDEDQARPMGRQARGVKGVTLKDNDDYVVNAEVVTPEDTVLVVCENGFGKRSRVEDFRQTKRGGVGVKSIITSERNGNVVSALQVNDEDGLVMISQKGQTVRTPVRDLRILGRATQGVKLVNLKEDDHLIAVEKIKHDEDKDSEPTVEGASAEVLDEAKPEE
ncbi:MAG: DNA topoisomerase (ATP-hydrolyzing) subunit A [Chlamydiia bacterium]|nr:DNA topoisomerase (ATP-hydrolyzing) subunit A [Chlamydiia bacterium]